MIDLTERIRRIREDSKKQPFTFNQECLDVYRALGHLSILMNMESEEDFNKAFDELLDAYARLMSHFAPSMTLEEPPSPLSEPMADAFYLQLALGDFTRFAASEGKDFPSLFHSLRAVFSIIGAHIK